jgi:hypothetical protein
LSVFPDRDLSVGLGSGDQSRAGLAFPDWMVAHSVDPVVSVFPGRTCRSAWVRPIMAWTIRHSEPGRWRWRRTASWPSSGSIVSRRINWSVWRPTRARAMSGTSGWPIAARTIVPVATVAGPVGPYYGSGTVPWMRWTITIRPTSPISVVVVSASRSPVPSPSALSPGLVIDQQCANANADPKTDQRGRGPTTPT